MYTPCSWQAWLYVSFWQPWCFKTPPSLSMGLSFCFPNIVAASSVAEYFHSFFLGFDRVDLLFRSSVPAIYVLFRSTLLAKWAVFFPMSSLQMTTLQREEEVELHRHGNVESCFATKAGCGCTLGYSCFSMVSCFFRARHVMSSPKQIVSACNYTLCSTHIASTMST
jgi:hypothetical protein